MHGYLTSVKFVFSCCSDGRIDQLLLSFIFFVLNSIPEIPLKAQVVLFEVNLQGNQIAIASLDSY